MKKTKIGSTCGLAVFALFFWLLPSVGEAGTKKLTCSATKTIQKALTSLKPGDTLLVSGTCNENVVVNEEKERITVDGLGSATINGPDNTAPTLNIRGRNITIKGFTSITGGRNGVVIIMGGSALIDGNTIHNTAGNGILLAQGSSARIINTTVRDNPACGISANNNSVVLVGFLSGQDTVASPSTIRDNNTGVCVSGLSNARIVESTISNNSRDGVSVTRVSHADISKSTIDSNGRHGIDVGENSGVNLGSDSGTGIFDAPNDTTVGSENTGSGIRCRVGGYANGRIGTLAGADPTSFGASCTDSLDVADTY